MRLLLTPCPTVLQRDTVTVRGVPEAGGQVPHDTQDGGALPVLLLPHNSHAEGVLDCGAVWPRIARESIVWFPPRARFWMLTYLASGEYRWLGFPAEIAPAAFMLTNAAALCSRRYASPAL